MNVSLEEIHSQRNVTRDTDHHFRDDYPYKIIYINHVVTCTIISVGLPLTLVAIYSLRSMVKDGNVAPIYVINLLLTDLLQFFTMTVKEVAEQTGQLLLGGVFTTVYLYCLFVSVGFMVCISLERYLVIAWPLWYRFRRTVKISVGVCVLVWILPALLVLLMLHVAVSMPLTAAIFVLLPLPLFIFFLVGTVRALAASRSVPSDEKRRIVGILVVVLLIYLLLFLPTVVMMLEESRDLTLIFVALLFLKLSPLADLFLYIFMKKGAVDKLLSSLCCCRMDGSDGTSPTVEMTPA